MDFTNDKIQELDKQFQPLYDSMANAMQIKNEKPKDKICPICGSNYVGQEPNDTYIESPVFCEHKIDDLFYGYYRCGECDHIFRVDPEYCWNGIPKGIKIT